MKYWNSHLRAFARGTAAAVFLLGLGLTGGTAFAQEGPEPPDGPPVPKPPDGREERPPRIPSGAMVTPNWPDWEIGEMMKYFAAQTGKNLVVEDEKSLSDKISVIGYKPVPVEAAYEAFLMALEAKGYTTVTAGGFTRIIKAGDAGKTPILVTDDQRAPGTWQYVTQIITPDNVSVSDLDKVVSSLISTNGKYIQYLPTNTLIITDSGVNLRKINNIIGDLDVAAPKSELDIIALQFATASEVASIIEQLYGTAESSTTSQPAPNARNNRRNRRARRDRNQPAEPTSAGTTAGKEAKYISKVLSDERTNSLIVLANEQGMKAVKDLIAKLDLDASSDRNAQIHVVYLEHAKAEDIAQVLSNLSQGTGGNTANNRRPNAAANRNTRAGAANNANANANAAGASNVVAAFDSGMRITHDENTNSLVIIANRDDFQVVKKVIDDLDVRRRQVFVDAVILEISSDDEFEFGAGVHGPVNTGIDDTLGIIGAQLGAQSVTGLSQDLLTGLATGIFGPSITVPFGGQELAVPAFGIVLQLLKSNSAVNIVSNPNLLTLDNEEAKIVVGRKIPFPTNSTINNLTGQPIVSFQREDVAITLQITPRINSTDFVTMELLVEASEIEEDNRGLDANTAGFITSKREVETSALVADNQTVVLGGLMGSTETNVETKIPILGDLPLIGTFFRGSRTSSRRTNLMIFLTPHIIDDNEDIAEVMAIKEAQRQEFLRRFYGKTQEQQAQELEKLLRFSMNQVGEESVWRDPEMKNAGRKGWEDEDEDGALRDAVEDGIDDAESDREEEQ